MELLDLPVELIQIIAEQTVRVCGFRAAQRKRLVNKLFSNEILRATFNSDILDPETLENNPFSSLPFLRVADMSTPLMAHYLRMKVMKDHSNTQEFAVRLRRTVEALVDYDRCGLDEDQLHSLRNEYTLQLCIAAIEELSGRFVVSDHLYKPVAPGKGDQASEDAMTEGLYTLAAAARIGHIQIVKHLLVEGVDADGACEYFGKAIHQAAFRGRNDIMLLLIQHGARIDDSPLFLAIRHGHLQIVEILLERGAKPQKRQWQSDYVYPLEQAVTGGYDRIAQKLLDYGIKRKHIWSNCFDARKFPLELL
ncbi:MAG: hypothetical protein Q9201_000961 [Fulgogasparrea decipioides]